MAVPFTRWATFVSQNLPKVTAIFLNQLQDAVSAGAYRSYDRIALTAYSEDQLTLRLVSMAGFMALDSATSQYVGVPPVSNVTMTIGGSLTSSSWQWIYARVTNGVVAYSVSATAPESTLRYKTGDETYRYMFAVYADSSFNLRRFTTRNGMYTFQEKLYLNGSDSAAASLSTGAWTTISYAAGSFPSSASSSRVHYQCWIGTGQTLFLRDSISNAPNTTTGARGISSTSLTSTSTLAVFTQEFVGTSSFSYYIASAGGTIVVKTMLDGFTE